MSFERRLSVTSAQLKFLSTASAWGARFRLWNQPTTFPTIQLRVVCKSATASSGV
jgi:hypothetical protein